MPWILAAAVAASACAGAPAKPDPRADTMLRLAEAKGRVRLDAQLQRRLVDLASEQPCPCAGQGSLADCATARPEPSCARAAFAVRALLRGLVRGAPDKTIRRWQKLRFSGAAPAKVDLSASPCRGDASAPVTVVVFSDFQCPACAAGRHLGEALLREAGPRVRLCFKNLPLVSIHPRALPAAKAAMAAHLQGRFWPMHDRLFGDQKRLERSDLLAHARHLKLDQQRFVADLDGDKAGLLVLEDWREASTLGLRGTPTFLVNGREVTGPMALPDLLDWVAEALALAAKQ